MTRLPGLAVIEASAGTGKTFTLVTRLMSLIFAGVAPERIAALTFSRLAAGEIFNSFIERLAKAASKPESAAEESARMKAFAGRDLSTADFASMLRRVIASQHLSPIGTIDSFLVRILGMMPMELGYGRSLEIMGDGEKKYETERLVGEALSSASPDAKALFKNAFDLFNAGREGKSFAANLEEQTGKWYEAYLARRDSANPAAGRAAWGDESRIWGDDIPAGLSTSVKPLRDLAPEFEKAAARRAAHPKRGAMPGPLLNVAKRLAMFSGKDPGLTKLFEEVDGEEGAALWKKTEELFCKYKIANALAKARGIYILMRTYEGLYEAGVRRRGKMTFADLPELVSSLPHGMRAELEYRLDSRFEHWALDEFQDTSRSQWRTIENLIDEAEQSTEGRTVLIVGDRKQAIYEWRGGDVSILSGQARLADGGPRSLVESYRYLPAISEALNTIFDANGIAGMFDLDGADDSCRWEFPRHESHDKSPDGFVQIFTGTKKAGQYAIDDCLEDVENAIKAVKPKEKGLSCAVLVRENRDGKAVCEHLRSKGMEAVFEGDADIADTQAMSAMAELATLAEHPGDEIAYNRIKRSPLGDAICAAFADASGEHPGAAALSAKLLDVFARQGLARTFRNIREMLKNVDGAWNGFLESRFADFMDCAAEFESMRTSSMRLSDFPAFYREKKIRDYAAPGMVRVMTIHQSKGLGFDFVIVPLVKDDVVKIKDDRDLLKSDDPVWCMPFPGAKAANSDGKLAKALLDMKRKQLYDRLCVYYVALTRAKKAMTVILSPGPKKDNADSFGPKTFSEIVRKACGLVGTGVKEFGDAEWHLKPVKKPDTKTAAVPDAPARGPRRTFAKSRPGEMFCKGLTGDRLFAEDFGVAAEKGVEAHGKFAAIEWLDAAAASTPLERALVKPSCGASVWREKPYEIFAHGTWESGRFDRVVFEGVDAERTATVYDFKTDRVRRGESREAFLSRLVSSHSAQMLRYGNAVSILCGIPRDKVKTVLLSTASMECAEVPPPVA